MVVPVGQVVSAETAEQVVPLDRLLETAGMVAPAVSEATVAMAAMGLAQLAQELPEETAEPVGQVVSADMVEQVVLRLPLAQTAAEAPAGLVATRVLVATGLTEHMEMQCRQTEVTVDMADRVVLVVATVLVELLVQAVRVAPQE